METLLENAGAGAISAPYTLPTNDAVVYIDGAFSGQAVTLERLNPVSGAFQPVANGDFTSATEKLLTLHKGATIRAIVSSGGTPSLTVLVMPRF